MSVTEEHIETLYRAPVRACIARPEMAHLPLSSDEADCIATAGLARREEYAKGRNAMKAALARLGVPTCSLPSRLDRSPAWPSGFVGSLSHCEGLCAAVVARRGDIAALGFDAEIGVPLAPVLASLICGPLDRPTLWSPSLARRSPWTTIVFSAKEAAFKCACGLFGAGPNLSDITIAFDLEDDEVSGSFEATFEKVAPSMPNWQLRGRWRIASDFVLTSAWPGFASPNCTAR